MQDSIPEIVPRKKKIFYDRTSFLCIPKNALGKLYSYFQDILRAKERGRDARKKTPLGPRLRKRGAAFSFWFIRSDNQGDGGGLPHIYPYLAKKRNKEASWEQMYSLCRKKHWWKMMPSPILRWREREKHGERINFGQLHTWHKPHHHWTQMFFRNFLLQFIEDPLPHRMRSCPRSSPCFFSLAHLLIFPFVQLLLCQTLTLRTLDRVCGKSCRLPLCAQQQFHASSCRITYEQLLVLYSMFLI